MAASEETGKQLTTYVPRYLIVDTNSDKINLEKVYDALTTLSGNRFYKVSAADVSKGGNLQEANVSNLVSMVEAEAQKRADEFVALHQQPADENGAAENKEEELKDENKHERKTNVKLEPSYPFFVLCSGIIETVEDAKVWMNGFTPTEPPEAARRKIEFDCGVEICVQSPSEEKTEEEKETKVGQLWKAQSEQNVLLDTVFSRMSIEIKDVGNIEDIARSLMKVLQEAHKTVTGFRSWREGAKEVTLSCKAAKFETRENGEEWDAYPKVENNEELKAEGEEVVGDSPPSADGGDAKEKDEKESRNVHCMDLYNSRLAQVPEECISVPIILYCLIEQVAANCVESPNEERKVDKARALAKLESLASYFEDSMTGLGGLQLNPTITKENENPVLLEDSHTIACTTAKAMVNQRNVNSNSSSTSKQPLIKIDEAQNFPTHVLSSKEFSLLKDKYPLKALGTRAFPNKPISNAERGLMRTQILNSAPDSSKFSIEDIDRALASIQFRSLIKKIENAWKTKDKFEVGKEVQDWKPEARAYVEDLSEFSMPQVLVNASRSLCGSVRTAWRYSPYNDTILLVCHAHTPILRRRHTKYQKFLYPSDLRLSKLPRSIHKLGPKPTCTYDIPSRYASMLCEETLYFPADQGRLGMIDTLFGRKSSKVLFLEKDGNIISMSNKNQEEKLEDPNLSFKASSQLLSKFSNGSSLVLQKIDASAAAIATTNVGLRVEFCSRSNCVYFSRPSAELSFGDKSVERDDDLREVMSDGNDEAENWRCVFENGMILVRRLNGASQLLLPDGRVMLRAKNDAMWRCVDNSGIISTITDSGGKADSKVGGKEAEQEEGRTEGDKTDEEKREEAKASENQGEGKGNKDTVHVVVQRDAQMRAIVTTREDMVMHILYDNGATLVQHADGTRIYSESTPESKGRRRYVVESPGLGSVTILRQPAPKKNLEVLAALGSVSKSLDSLTAAFTEKMPEEKAEDDKGSDENTNTGDEKDAKLKPKKHHEISIHVPNFGSIDRLENASLVVKQESGERFIMDTSGKVVLIPSGQSTVPLTRELLGGVVSKNHIPIEAYLFEMAIGTISVVDREENMFKVSLTGKNESRLSRDLGPGAGNSDALLSNESAPDKNYAAHDSGQTQTIMIPAQYYSPPVNAATPRLFCVRRDGSGYELHTKDRVDTLLKSMSSKRDTYVELPHLVHEKEITDTSKKAGALATETKSRREEKQSENEAEEEIEMDDDDDIDDADNKKDISHGNNKASIPSREPTSSESGSPLEAQKSQSSRALSSASSKKHTIKVLRRVLPDPPYRRTPKFPNVIQSGVYSSVKRNSPNSVGTSGRAIFPPQPVTNKEFVQVVTADLPSENVLHKPIYAYRYIRKQKTLPEGATEIVQKNLTLFKEKEVQLKQRKESTTSKASNSRIDEKASNKATSNEEVVRIQLAVLAARQHNHERLSSVLHQSDQNQSPDRIGAVNNDEHNPHLHNPHGTEPRQFFEKSSNAPLQKVGDGKFKLSSKSGTKVDKQKFKKFFAHPSNKRYFELHKILRQMFTQLKGAKMSKKISGTQKSKNVKPDETVNLHWLPEKDLYQNLHALEGFVKCVSRCLSNPRDPTLRAVKLSIPPYSDLLKTPKVEENSERMLECLGFCKQGQVMVLDADVRVLRRGIDETNYFIDRVSEHLSNVNAERVGIRKPSKREKLPRTSARGSRRVEAAYLNMKPQGANAATHSDFDVKNCTNASQFHVMDSKSDEHKSSQVRPLPLQKQASGMRLQTRRSPDQDRLHLKHRPVHYNVSNARRMKSMEYKHTKVAIGTKNEYVEREAPARKRLQTSSTFQLSKRNGVDGLFTELILRPSSVNFGELRAGSLYGFMLTLRNEGNQSGRYLVHQPKLIRGQRNMLRVVFKPGVLASGMTASIEVQLWAGQMGEYEDEIHIQTETTEHVLPVHATITATARHSTRARSSAPGHTRLISRRMPVAFERAMGNVQSDTAKKIEKKIYEDPVKRPVLPDFTTTFNPDDVHEPPKGRNFESKQLGTEANSDAGTDDAGPIPDADEATAEKSNQALEKKMLESMRNM